MTAGRLRLQLLALLVGALTFAVLFAPSGRSTLATFTGTAKNATNHVANLSLVSPSGLVASTVAGSSVTLSWTAATPNNGNGNGYAITALNNGTSTTCPNSISSYTSWIGSTGTGTTTFSDTGGIVRGAAGTFACYLVQTGYSPTSSPPWSSRPLWTSQGSLAIALVALGLSLVQAGSEQVGGTTVSAVTNTASTAGNLLVATVISSDDTTAFSGPAGWTRAARAAQAGDGAVEIWYQANNPGGVTQAAFSDPVAVGMLAEMAEFQGPTSTPLDKTGTVTDGVGATSATASTSAATTVNGELAVTAFMNGSSCSYTSPSGWSNLVNDGFTGYISDYRLGIAAGTVSETMNCGTSSLWAGAIATFK